MGSWLSLLARSSNASCKRHFEYCERRTLPPPEIADSNDGHAVNDGTDKRPRPFLFDVFAEEDDRLVDDGRPPAKWRCRASSASSSVRAEQAQTLFVVNLPHDVGLYGRSEP